MPAQITTPRNSAVALFSLPPHNYIASARRLCVLICCSIAAATQANVPGTSAADASADSAVYVPAARGLTVASALRMLLHEPASTTEFAAALAFYRDRDFAPAWLDAKRQMELQQLSALAHLHGLNSADYALSLQLTLAQQTADPAALARAELAATTTVARLAMHLASGRIDQIGRYPEARANSVLSNPRAASLLTAAAESDSLFSYLHSLAPDTLLYRKLLSSLARYRQLVQQATDGSVQLARPAIADGRVLEIGMADRRVPALRARLELPERQDTTYDAELAAAVADFQRRHKLGADGVLGPRTVRALNVPLAARIAQLRVNLDAQRWAAMPAAATYLRVNIAQFELQLIEAGTAVWSMRTQVGRRTRPTPVFKSELQSIVANPTWTVPPTIFREDVLPRIQQDPGYLAAQNMYPVDARGRAVDSTTIEWASVTADSFPYRIRSGPWPGNALGKLKFQMPNPYLIYLHDTPSRHLFKGSMRATSSGCIRLEHPQELATRLMSYQSAKQQARMRAALATDQTRYIALDQPLPIVVMYATIDLGADNELVFAEDIYRNDVLAAAALDRTLSDSEPVMFARLEAAAPLPR